MDMKLFENAPDAAPFLVRLYDSHRYYSLACEDRPQARADLTEAVAHLLQQNLGAREGELVADVLITLLRQAEMDLRCALAERLAAMDTVPLRLVLNLANDEIAVAAPVLRDSPVLSDLDLIYIVKSHGAEHWRSIAARDGLGDDLIDLLAEKRDISTAIILSENQRITLTSFAMNVMSSMAGESESLARPLLARAELPVDIARKLYNHVSPALKTYIAQHFEGALPADVKGAVDDLFLEFGDEADADPFTPSDESMKAAKQMAAVDHLNMTAIMDTLRRGQIKSYIAMMSVYTHLPVAAIRDVIEQSSGRKLAVLCRALELHKGDFSTMYLLTHRVRSRDRLVNHNELLAALSYFDRVPVDTAKKLMGFTV